LRGPSIAPESMLRALLLQVFLSIRSGRLLVEQIDYSLLFRWFVGLSMYDVVWNHAVFSKNRDRLLNTEVAQRFFAEVNRRCRCTTLQEELRQGVEAGLPGHILVENRHGLIVAAMVTHADGYAERDAALLMLQEKQEGHAGASPWARDTIQRLRRSRHRSSCCQREGVHLTSGTAKGEIPLRQDALVQNQVVHGPVALKCRQRETLPL